MILLLSYNTLFSHKVILNHRLMLSHIVMLSHKIMLCHKVILSDKSHVGQLGTQEECPGFEPANILGCARKPQPWHDYLEAVSIEDMTLHYQHYNCKILHNFSLPG